MTDDSKFVISPRDLDCITDMIPGSYPMQETAGGERYFDLVIQEQLLNGVHQAIKMTNKIVDRVNQRLANPTRGGNVTGRQVRKRSGHQPYSRGSQRLVEVLAILKRATLAVTYKVEGRKISRVDAVENMTSDIRQLRAFISHIDQHGEMTDHSFTSVEKRELKQSLDLVKEPINLAEDSPMTIDLDQIYSNEPIVRCLYPDNVNINDGDVWNGYKAWCQDHDRTLHVEAMKSTVGAVKWLTGEVIELSLYQQRFKLFVTPLKPVPEGHRDDEVRVGDIAVLLGQYVAIGEGDEDSSGPDAAFSMINYLRIVKMEEQNQSRRGKNRIQEFDAKVLCRFH